MDQNMLSTQMSDEEVEQLFSEYANYSQNIENYVIPDADKRRSFLTKEDHPFNYSHSSLVNLQRACWNKFHTNPQVNTSVRDMIGAITGHDFEINSEQFEVQEALTEIFDDPRNALYDNLGKHIGRAEIEGELYLSLSVHKTGFVEIDFIDPSTVQGWGSTPTGVMNHPKKKGFPLAYMITDPVDNSREIIPSINLAYFPELYSELKKNRDYAEDLAKENKKSDRVFSKLNGFFRFIVSWDRSLFTTRNTSHLRTTIEWINRYELLKTLEVDHKRSVGAYLWTMQFEDMRSFKTWMALPDDQKKKTGLMAPKVPGSTLFVPPGMTLNCVNPTLPKISDQDTDIMEMVTSGLNQPQDMITGTSKGTYGSVKASRGPQVDRTKNECEYYGRFLKKTLFRGVFFLRNAVLPSFKLEYKVRKAVTFKSRKPIFKTIIKKAHELLEVTFPVSEVADIEAVARGLLGVKHGSIVETMGSPRKLIHKKMGLGSYHKARLENAEEDEMYPEVLLTADAESSQEQDIEPPVKKEAGDKEDSSDKENKKEEPAAKKKLVTRRKS